MVSMRTSNIDLTEEAVLMQIEEAGRSIDHLHVILLPRFKGDLENPSGGIRNVIPDRAHYQRK